MSETATKITPSLSLHDRLAQGSAEMFCCPGETLPVSRAVHLSRLANFYPACRTCLHADDARACIVAEVAPQIADRQPAISVDLFQANGIRGTYLSALNRSVAEQLAAAYAAAIWTRAPRQVCDEDELSRRTTSGVAAPRIVVSRDAAAASPDISCGVVRGLRRMGCHVFELGAVSRPMLDFGVYHLQADGGVHITGAGAGRAETGLDLIDGEGVTWSNPGMLEDVRGHWTARTGRPTRRGGRLDACDLRATAAAEFQRQGLGLRPLRIGVVHDCPVQRSQLVQWCSDWPVAFVPVSGVANWSDTGELARQQRRLLRGLFAEQDLQWIVRIAADGRRLQLLDEHFRPVEPSAWLVRLVEHEPPSRSRRIVVSPAVSPIARGRLRSLGWEVNVAGATHESLVRRLIDDGARLAADGDGRIWFADHYPLCDGMATLARLARLAGQTGAAVSHWAT